MNSKLLSASVLALAALSAGSAFAEGRGIYPDTATFVGTKSRAEVQAELAQARRDGFNVNLSRNWSGDNTASASTKTRAQVRQETLGGANFSAAADRDYPVVR